MGIARENKAITYNVEKRLLDFLGGRLYKHFSADQMTFLGFSGAIIAATGYILSARNIGWIHLVNFGILVNWFGDSLDGRIAHYRGEERPKMGFYLDHMMDAFSLTVTGLGLYISGSTLSWGWLSTLILYLIIMVHLAFKSAATGLFELSVGIIGPTEARLITIFGNLLVIVLSNAVVRIAGVVLTVLDLYGFFFTLLLVYCLLRAFITTIIGKARIQED